VKRAVDCVRIAHCPEDCEGQYVPDMELTDSTLHRLSLLHSTIPSPFQ
jgi:hypothetical protein